MKPAWDKILLFTFSICLILGLLSIAILKRTMNDQQWFVCVWALAFGGAGFAAFLPGSIEWQVKPGLKATGAFAVLLLVVFFGRSVKSAHGDIKDWQLVPPPLEEGHPGPDPEKAVVLVFLNDKMVKAFGTPSPWLNQPSPSQPRDITIFRAPGSIRVQINDAEAGSKLFFVVEDDNQFWISPELPVPPPYSLSLERKPEAFMRKRLP